MGKYISKSAAVAEIEKIKEGLQRNGNPNPLGNLQECLAAAEIEALNLIKDSLDSLEVKEVDYAPIDNDFERDAVNFCFDNGLNTTPRIAKTIAKHFFEHGLNASNPLTWEDIDLILDITDQIANDDSMEEKLNNMSQEKYCTEVLKRFKEQKGEMGYVHKI